MAEKEKYVTTRISLAGMTIEEALKKAMDAGPYPASEAKRKKPTKKRAPSRSSPGTSPAVPKRSPRVS